MHPVSNAASHSQEIEKLAKKSLETVETIYNT